MKAKNTKAKNTKVKNTKVKKYKGKEKIQRQRENTMAKRKYKGNEAKKI